MGMARYINREDIIEEINDAISNISFTSPYQNDIGTMVSGMERVLGIVEDAPISDVVPVVRCKDCKNFTPKGMTYTWCDWWGVDPDEDDFCSHGERKDND